MCRKEVPVKQFFSRPDLQSWKCAYTACDPPDILEGGEASAVLAAHPPGAGRSRDHPHHRVPPHPSHITVTLAT